ncbi:hypothetical protein PHLGIDRAFT_247369 [Phlebiopsis gigantea 11061_1 CR5-6]|uniref:Uncharacterized protein n=1 Tax=Phlebiopsis gigantea (strain 11061_1 CR5-6) TaxID=745531 RepID=A0A0C3PDB6_PHLG1|nr:hypothetical protein PHLGIDRAFT_247369 [Phlebiopsis gigantea 11061_1 CR5-6]
MRRACTCPYSPPRRLVTYLVCFESSLLLLGTNANNLSHTFDFNVSWLLYLLYVNMNPLLATCIEVASLDLLCDEGTLGNTRKPKFLPD